MLHGSQHKNERNMYDRSEAESGVCGLSLINKFRNTVHILTTWHKKTMLYAADVGEPLHILVCHFVAIHPQDIATTRAASATNDHPS